MEKRKLGGNKMNSLQGELVKAGIVSQEKVLQLKAEHEKRKQEKRERKNREEILTQRHNNVLELLRRSWEPIPLPDPSKPNGFIALQLLTQDLLQNYTKGELKNHRCMVCGTEGSSRLEICRAHSEHLKEHGLKWMFDQEANQQFLTSFLDKTGVLLDHVGNMNNVEYWICLKCKGEVALLKGYAYKVFCKLVFLADCDEEEFLRTGKM